MVTRPVLCIVCLGLTAPLAAECLTSLPMSQLEDCILTEAAGRSYSVEARPDVQPSGDEPAALLPRPGAAHPDGAVAGIVARTP